MDDSDDELIDEPPLRISRPASTKYVCGDDKQTLWSFEEVLKSVKESASTKHELKEAESNFFVDESILYGKMQQRKQVEDTDLDYDEVQDSVDNNGRSYFLNPFISDVSSPYFCYALKPSDSENQSISKLYTALEHTNNDVDDLLEILCRRYVLKFIAIKEIHIPQDVIEWLLRLIARHPWPVITNAALLNIKALLKNPEINIHIQSASSLSPLRGLTQKLLDMFFDEVGVSWNNAADEMPSIKCGRRTNTEAHDNCISDGNSPSPSAFFDTNMNPFLSAISLLLRSRCHCLSDSELSNLFIQLAMISLDINVAAACSYNVQEAMLAAIDSITEEYWSDDKKFDALISKLNNFEGFSIPYCPTTCVILSRTLSSNSSRSREVQGAFCFQSLRKRLLSHTTYATEYPRISIRNASGEQALSALNVLLNVIDSTQAETQFAVLGCVQSLCHASSKKNDKKLKDIARVAESISSRLRYTMHTDVMKSKDLIAVLAAECNSGRSKGDMQNILFDTQGEVNSD